MTIDVYNGPTVILGLIIFLLLAHILYPTKEKASSDSDSKP